MPKTAACGLEQPDWVDARLSLGRATNAAVAHLRDLIERFGRWDLALAAYNLGHEGVLRAMARAAAARDPSERGDLGFAALAQAGVLPQETADYVPQIRPARVAPASAWRVVDLTMTSQVGMLSAEAHKTGMKRR